MVNDETSNFTRIRHRVAGSSFGKVFVFVSILIWVLLLSLDWSDKGLEFLGILILSFVLIPFWAVLVGSDKWALALAFIAIVFSVFALLIVRMWFSVNLSWRLSDSGDGYSNLGAVVISYPQRIYAGDEGKHITVAHTSPLTSTIQLTLTAQTSTMGTISASCVLSSSVLNSCTATVFDSIGPGMALLPASSNMTGTQSTSPIVAVSHNHQLAECEHPFDSTHESYIEYATKLVSRSDLFLGMMVGRDCHFIDVPIDVTMRESGGDSSIITDTFSIAVETISHAAYRNIVNNDVSTNSPVLIVLPALVAFVTFFVKYKLEFEAEEKEKQRNFEAEEKEKQREEERERKQEEKRAQEESEAAFSAHWEEFLTALASLDAAKAQDAEKRLRNLDYRGPGAGRLQEAESLIRLMQHGPDDFVKLLVTFHEFQDATVGALIIFVNATTVLHNRALIGASIDHLLRDAMYANVDSNLKTALGTAREKVYEVDAVEGLPLTGVSLTHHYRDSEITAAWLQNSFGDYNPFKFTSGETERPDIWATVGAFWDKHPIYYHVLHSWSPLVIEGEYGSGKTALVYAVVLGALTLEDNTLVLPVWSTTRLSITGLHRILASALLEEARAHPARLFRAGVAQERRAQLAQYLASMLGRGNILVTLELAEEQFLRLPDSEMQKANRERMITYIESFAAVVRNVPDVSVTYPANGWLSQMTALASAVGYGQICMLLDNVPLTLAADRLELLSDLRDYGILTIAFTESRTIAEQLSFHGFQHESLRWTEQQLWEMAEQRLVVFNELAMQKKSSGAGVPLTSFQTDLFQDEAWQFAHSLQFETPRRMITFWRNMFRIEPAEGQGLFSSEDVRRVWDAIDSDDSYTGR